MTHRRIVIGLALGVLAFGLLVWSQADSSSPAEQEVRDQANEFWDAVMRGDGEVACSLATTEGQEELAPIRGGPQKAENCEKGVEIHGKANLGAGSTEFAGADVKIAGDDATAQSGIGFCMRLKKVDGTWLVDAGPGPVLPGDPPECTP